MKRKKDYYIPMITGHRSVKGTVCQSSISPEQKNNRIMAGVLRGDVVEIRFEGNTNGGGVFWTTIESRG